MRCIFLWRALILPLLNLDRERTLVRAGCKSFQWIWIRPLLSCHASNVIVEYETSRQLGQSVGRATREKSGGRRRIVHRHVEATGIVLVSSHFHVLLERNGIDLAVPYNRPSSMSQVQLNDGAI